MTVSASGLPAASFTCAWMDADLPTGAAASATMASRVTGSLDIGFRLRETAACRSLGALF